MDNENSFEGPSVEDYELLKGTRQLSARDQERLVRSISDPDIAIEVLTYIEEGRVFTEQERMYLFEAFASNLESVHVFLINLVESGVVGSLNNTEEWLIDQVRVRLAKIIDSDDLEAVEYMKEEILPLLKEIEAGE
jgi:hypothetical protein